MNFIKLGECNKKLLYPLLGGIFKIIVNIILYLVPDKAKINKHPFILGMNAGLGMSLAIIPFIYSLKKLKINNIERINPGKVVDDNNMSNDTKIKCEKYIIIILCSLFDFTQKILVFVFSKDITNNVWIFNIIFLNVFTSMLVNNPIYKHQYLSSGIMVLGGIGLNIINLYNMKLNELPLLFLSIFIEIINSLTIVLAKYGMDYRFCSPFEITFYEGIFALIINIIFLLISTYIPLKQNFKYTKLLKLCEDDDGKKYLDNIILYFKNIDFTEVVLFIVIMVSRVFFNLFSHFTIKHFTSSHVVLLLIMGEISLDWAKNSTLELVFTIIIFIIELFMLLIFCEIIELKFCGLSDDTRKNIEKRAKLVVIDGGKSFDSVGIGLELSSNISSQGN